MNSRWFVSLVLTACFAVCAGCRKSSSNASSPTPAAAEGDTPSVEQAAETAAQLTQLVRKYAAEQRQAPKTLDELVAKGYLERIPAAPKGQQYAISKNLRVYLANP